MATKKKYYAYYQKNYDASNKYKTKVIQSDRFKAQDYLRKKYNDNTIIVEYIEERE